MQKFKILIADDHAMIRAGVKNLLSRVKEVSVVGEAENGEQTIQLYNKLQPNLLLLDISMPDMNGMEVASQILSLNPNASILILSMYDDEDYVSRCIEVGVRGYVVKSESSSELEYAVKAVLQGKTYFSRHAQEVILNKYKQTIVKKKQREDLVKLTNREIEIIKLIDEGLTSMEMADKLFISPRTVETHRANLMKKFGVKNAIELVKRARSLQLLN